MMKKSKIEFVDSKVEREEITGFSFKGFIDGSLLTLNAVVRQIPFILFLVFLAVIYIANRYHAEKVVRQVTSLKRQVKNLRAEEITTASELMNLSKPSSVQAMLEDRDIDLKESVDPPYKIVVERK
jgi:cell division protein FtsB